MQAQYLTRLIYRRLDENGDYVWGNSQNDMLSGLAAMRQVIQTRLHAIQGEWWEGDRTALPWLTEILAAPAGERRRQMVDLMVTSRLLDTVGVLAVEDVSSSLIGRQYTYKANVRTIYGDTEAEVRF